MQLLRFASLFLLLPNASSLEAKFSPNPADSLEDGGNGGPLPASAAQRRQLLQLDVAIANSPHPSSTLAQVAQQHGLSNEELMGILQRNRNDLQHSGILEEMLHEIHQDASLLPAERKRTNQTLVTTILSIAVAFAKRTTHQVSRHPRLFTLVGASSLLVLWVMHNAPKNGVVLSLTHSPFSRGPTTVWNPPRKYLQEYYLSTWKREHWENTLVDSNYGRKQSKRSNKTRKHHHVGRTQSLVLDTSDATAHDMIVQTKVDVEGFDLVVSAYQMIPMDSLIGSVVDFQKDTMDSDILPDLVEGMLHSISCILDEREFSEYPSEKKTLNFRSFLMSEDDEETEGAIVVMKGLGDWGRFGIQPLCLLYEDHHNDKEDDCIQQSAWSRCIAYHTLKGGHFDGDIRISMDQRTIQCDGEEVMGVVVHVVLAIPKGQRAPPIRLAESMVSSLAHSIVVSSELRMKQSLSRRSQSKFYRIRASRRASEKRHLKYEQEKNQEEMAEERKRRWKRNNPDAGHYRPSGHRLRSPEGKPSYSF